MAAPIPWHGAGSATYLYTPNPNGPKIEGFVQAVKRLGRAEADVVRIAPRLDAGEAATQVWSQLLDHVVASAGEHGIQRLYVCLQSDNPAREAVARSGFAPYIDETLYHLPEVSAQLAQSPPDSPHVRPQMEKDSFALQRLHRCYTPPLVQYAEGTLLNNGETPSPLDLRAWWQPEQFEGFVYEHQGEIVAAVQVQRGRRAHWLRILADSGAVDAVEALLDYALYAVAHYRKRTLYCSLRPYQEGLASGLEAVGFAPVTSLTRMVKHTTRELKAEAAVPAKELFEVTLTGILTSNYPQSTLHANTESGTAPCNGKAS